MIYRAAMGRTTPGDESEEVYKSLLSEGELERYEWLSMAPHMTSRERKIGNLRPPLAARKRTFAASAVWMMGCLAAAVWIGRPDRDDAAVTFLLLWLLYGAIGVFRLAHLDAKSWLRTLAPAYLEKVGYQARVDEVGCPARIEEAWVKQRTRGRTRRPDWDGDGTDNGRTYPVTGGMYDPDLYRSRGGRNTFERMQRYGIDDYDTYKTNVLESD